MAKVGRLTLLVLRKEFLIAFGGTFFAVLGVAGTILTIGDWHLTLTYVASVSIFALLASLVVNWRRMIPPQVAVDDTLVFEGEDVISKNVRCPCDMKLARAATELATKCFATTVTISANSHEQLRVKNPYILACLTDAHGRLLGY